MGVPAEPENAVLIAGLLVGDAALLPQVHTELAALLGRLERISPIWPFANTEYYADELGSSTRRQFVTFAEPFALERLVEVKLATNALESEFARRLGDAARRPVNIDPGYLTLAALVLATTKSRAHRIYLGRGIYAEVTLNYERGGWRGWPWTYPDFADAAYHPFLAQVRADLKRRRHAQPSAPPAQNHTPADKSD